MRARLAVYVNPFAAERSHTPYFVDVQNDDISGLQTRVVVPLRRAAAFGPRAHERSPLLQVAGEPVVLATAAIGAVPLSELRTPAGDVRPFRVEIQNALDALFGVLKNWRTAARRAAIAPVCQAMAEGRRSRTYPGSG
ncbi:MAG: CcdB family protein [Comamonadaceae bacterium]|nr:CcdB family protein [Comamonadaceae bacterium]